MAVNSQGIKKEKAEVATQTKVDLEPLMYKLTKMVKEGEGKFQELILINFLLLINQIKILEKL